MPYQRYNPRGAQMNPWQNGAGGLLPHPGGVVDPLALVGNLVGAIMGGQGAMLGPSQMGMMGMGNQVRVKKGDTKL